MKRAPSPRPPWIRTCKIEHRSGNVIDFPVIDDAPSLLWLINLGCIDLNPWYAPCDDFNRPDYLHLDLDPFDAPFSAVREAALIVRDVFASLGMRPYVKTTGSKGMHVYVGIRRGPSQHQVLGSGQGLIARHRANASRSLDRRVPRGQTAARPSAFGLQPKSRSGGRLPRFTRFVLTKRPWCPRRLRGKRSKAGCESSDFTMLDVPERIERIGDLWAPLLSKRGRFDLEKLAHRLHVAV